MKCPNCQSKIEDFDIVATVYSDDEVELTVECEDCGSRYYTFIKLDNLVKQIDD